MSYIINSVYMNEKVTAAANYEVCNLPCTGN